MGFHTVVVIKNDQFHEVQANPQEFVSGIIQGMHNPAKSRIQIQHGTAATVLQSQHDDITEIVKVRHGYPTVEMQAFEYGNNDTHAEVSYLKKLAERHGYKLVKSRKKKEVTV